MKLFVFYLCILLLPAMASAETTPCTDCAGCNEIIQDANNGDTVQLTANITDHDDTCIEFNGKDGITFDCENHLIDGNLIGYGIYLSGSNTNTITNCEITGFFEGIHLYQSPNNILTDITSIGNSFIGVNIAESSYTTISNSHITGNSEIGINVHKSGMNLIYNNYFKNSNNIAFIETTQPNTFNTIKTIGTNIVGDPYIGGNYWAYPNGTGFSETCTDFDKNGFCDLPYIINPDNTDYLPLSSAYAKAHTVYGSCMDADDGTPAEDSIITAYIESRPGETINDVVGSSGNSGIDNGWTVNIGNLDTPWSVDDILIIEADNGGGYFDRTAVILTDAESDEAPDMKLKHQSDPGNIALVMGQITNAETGVSGATVYIECLYDSNYITTISDANGYYYATLACPIDETVQVTATIGTETGTNTGLVEDIGTAETEVNVGLAHIDVTIPEFPIAAIPAILSMLSFGLLRKRLF